MCRERLEPPQRETQRGRGTEKVLVTFEAPTEAALQTRKVFFWPEKTCFGLGSLVYSAAQPPRALSHLAQERQDQVAAPGRRKVGEGPSQAVPGASPARAAHCSFWPETPPQITPLLSQRPNKAKAGMGARGSSVSSET